ncbi:MAG: glycosyltransferase family 2 protein [Candidatus Competibacteraceae bacterium]
MSVFNSVSSLALTLDSVLDQQDVDLEFVVVSDGSNDGSAELLNDYAAKDSRLRIIHQKNCGLTRALIRGCAEAEGEYIALRMRAVIFVTWSLCRSIGSFAEI